MQNLGCYLAVVSMNHINKPSQTRYSIICMGPQLTKGTKAIQGRINAAAYDQTDLTFAQCPIELQLSLGYHSMFAQVVDSRRSYKTVLEDHPVDL